MRFILAAALAALPLLTAGASAQMSERDLAIIGRALNFVEGGQPGQRVVALIYDDAGQAEADALNAAMSGGYSARDITMVSRMVPASEAASSLSGVDAAILLGGVSGGNPAIAQAAGSNGVMTVSANMGCVTSGQCVLGVQSAPAVRIVVSQSAANAASVSFATAFAMMIEQI